MHLDCITNGKVVILLKSNIYIYFFAIFTKMEQNALTLNNELLLLENAILCTY